MKRTPSVPLTSREKDVLRLLARGYTNKRIASTLNISPKTVEACLTRLYVKIKARNRVQAATYFLLHRKSLENQGSDRQPTDDSPPSSPPGGSS